MPPKKDPQHRHLKEAPRARHKAKPTFDLPAAGVPEVTATPGWAFRADEAPPVQSEAEAPRARHKTKPKFDLPAESGVAEVSAAVGWVYRADEPAPPVHSNVPAAFHLITEAPPVIQDAEHDFRDNPLLTVGMGFYLIGLGTVNFVSLAVHGFFVAPLRFAQGLLTSD